MYLVKCVILLAIISAVYTAQRSYWRKSVRYSQPLQYRRYQSSNQNYGQYNFGQYFRQQYPLLYEPINYQEEDCNGNQQPQPQTQYIPVAPNNDCPQSQYGCNSYCNNFPCYGNAPGSGQPPVEVQTTGVQLAPPAQYISYQQPIGSSNVLTYPQPEDPFKNVPVEYIDVQNPAVSGREQVQYSGVPVSTQVNGQAYYTGNTGFQYKSQLPVYVKTKKKSKNHNNLKVTVGKPQFSLNQVSTKPIVTSFSRTFTPTAENPSIELNFVNGEQVLTGKSETSNTKTTNEPESVTEQEKQEENEEKEDEEEKVEENTTTTKSVITTKKKEESEENSEGNDEEETNENNLSEAKVPENQEKEIKPISTVEPETKTNENETDEDENGIKPNDSLYDNQEDDGKDNEEDENPEPVNQWL